MLDNGHSLLPYLPSLTLGAGALVVLAADLVARRPSGARAFGLALLTLLLATAAQLATTIPTGRSLFFGLLARDPFADFFALLFLGTNALCALAAWRRDEDEGAAELQALLMTTTLGMLLMASATDLLTAFLGLETVSLMSYVLAGFRRRSRASAEAALKYVIYGGVASGVMLYGMSLLYGLAGATSFGAVRDACAGSPAVTTVLLAVVFCLCGFGYKIAAVPFHMWCPDVYEGAPTPVTAFLSVGPKAAGFALLVRFFDGAVPLKMGPTTLPWSLLLGLLAAASMTLGNLAALQQTSLKRLLAYSSIAHAGYLLLGVAAGGSDGERALLLYLVVYLFMGLGAFVVVLAVEDAGVPATMSAWRGLGRRAPLEAALMTIFLFALTGLPPLSGFFGKFYLFYALVARGGGFMTTLAVIGILNSALSLYFYARVTKAMYFEAGETEGALPTPRRQRWLALALAAPTVLLFLGWSPLARRVDDALARWNPPLSDVSRR